MREGDIIYNIQQTSIIGRKIKYFPMCSRFFSFFFHTNQYRGKSIKKRHRQNNNYCLYIHINMVNKNKQNIVYTWYCSPSAGVPRLIQRGLPSFSATRISLIHPAKLSPAGKVSLATPSSVARSRRRSLPKQRPPT